MRIFTVSCLEPHLMGHADIQTTMLYVQLAPEDVWREYARAVAQRLPLSTPEKTS
jgi:hypothetical protein